MLPYVLVAIVGATMLRSLLLYAQTVETNRIVMRMTTDMQRVGFAHLITSDFARLSRETPGRLVSKLTNDIGFVQKAAQAALNTAVRDALTIVALVASMIYLDWVMSVIVLCVYPIAALPVAALSTKLRRVAKQTQQRARRHDLAADREAVGRAPDQVVPPGGLRRRPAQRELRAGLPAAHEGGEEPRAHRPAARGARRHRHRRRHRASPTGASPAASRRSATSWASSPRC